MEIMGGTIRYTAGGVLHDRAFSTQTGNNLPGLGIDVVTKNARGATLVTVSLRPASRILLHDLALEATFPFESDDRIFCNGYQSWTDSREFGVTERQRGIRRIMRLIRLDRYGDAHFLPYPGGPGRFHAHTYCAVRRGAECTLAGSLSEEQGYTLFQFDTTRQRLAIRKECEGLALERPSPVLELAIIRGEVNGAYDRYFSLQRITAAKHPPVTGWTSWYNHYTKITEEIIRGNLASLAERKVPIDYFQIDDGFQTAVGDWLSIKPAFSGGMGPIADEIHRHGFRAGLWLAPFICERKSETALLHPDWLVRDGSGKPAVAGWNPGWSGEFLALDIYHDEVRAWLRGVFNTVLGDWGYDLVKLDFLYAAAILPRAGKSRGAIMTDAMRFLRELVGEKKILGCGVPLGPAFGIVDFCRIGSDVALRWEDPRLVFGRYRERVSTFNSLTSTIGRGRLDGRAFANDPDVFILRAENNRLSDAEKGTLFLLNNIFGGLLFTSDDVGTYAPETMRLYLSMFPAREKRIGTVDQEEGLYTIRFTIDGRSYLACANLSNDERPVTLGEGVFFHAGPGNDAASFTAGPCALRLKAHESRCFLQLDRKTPSIAGSTGHLFPGCDIERFTASGTKLTVRRHPHAPRPATVYLRVAKPGSCIVNGKKVPVETVLPGVHVAMIVME